MDLRERDYELLRVALLPEGKKREEERRELAEYHFFSIDDVNARWAELRGAGLIGDDDGLTDAGKAALSPPVPVIVTSGCYIRRKEVVEAWRAPLPGETAAPYPDWLREAFEASAAVGGESEIIVYPGVAPERCRPGDWIYRNSLGTIGVLTGPAFASKYARVP